MNLTEGETTTDRRYGRATGSHRPHSHRPHILLVGHQEGYVSPQGEGLLAIQERREGLTN